jgi:hypothetical protein
MKTAEDIFESQIGSNQELGYKPITKEDVLRCIHEALSVKSQDIIATIKPILSDDVINALRDDYGKFWKELNAEYPGADDYLSGINDGMYALRNWMIQL